MSRHPTHGGDPVAPLPQTGTGRFKMLRPTLCRLDVVPIRLDPSTGSYRKRMNHLWLLLPPATVGAFAVEIILMSAHMISYATISLRSHPFATKVLAARVHFEPSGALPPPRDPYKNRHSDSRSGAKHYQNSDSCALGPTP